MDFPTKVSDTDWLFWSHNGIRWPDARRTVMYLGSRLYEPTGRYLFTIYGEHALLFPNRLRAVAWLKRQPHDYGSVQLTSGATLKDHWLVAPFAKPEREAGAWL